MFDIQVIPNVCYSGFAVQPPRVLLAPDGLLLLLLPPRLVWTTLPGEVNCQQGNIKETKQNQGKLWPEFEKDTY